MKFGIQILYNFFLHFAKNKHGDVTGTFILRLSKLQGRIMAIYKTNNTVFLIGNVKIFAIRNNWSIISQILKTRTLV